MDLNRGMSIGYACRAMTIGFSGRSGVAPSEFLQVIPLLTPMATLTFCSMDIYRMPGAELAREARAGIVSIPPPRSWANITSYLV